MEKISKSTQWWRDNKEKATAKAAIRKGTLDGKLINLITTSRYRCKESGLEHDIDTAYLRGLYAGQEGKCALSGLQMIIRAPRKSDGFWMSISLDRIDSRIGYIQGNVQLTCTGVNLMKKDMPNEMFINFCKKVTEMNV